MEYNEFGQYVGFKVEEWSPRQHPVADTLYGRFCDLIPLNSEAHGPILFDSLVTHGQEDLFTYMHFGPFPSAEVFVRWLKDGESTEVGYSVIDRRDNKVHGFISLHSVDVENGVVEIGVFLSKALHGTAISTEIVYFLLCEVFDRFHYRRCQWRCDTFNHKSIKLATRIGFQYEGTFRQFYVVKGRSCNISWFSILNSEWPDIRLKLENWLRPSNFDSYGRQINKLLP